MGGCSPLLIGEELWSRNITLYKPLLWISPFWRASGERGNRRSSDISDCFHRVCLYVCLTWVHPMTPMDTEYTYVWEAPGDFGRLSHRSGVGPWGGVHLC